MFNYFRQKKAGDDSGGGEGGGMLERYAIMEPERIEASSVVIQIDKTAKC